MAPAASASTPYVSVAARFDLPESCGISAERCRQRFDASNMEVAVLGLPEGAEPTKPEPGSYSYSGMHDHGPLPPPREGGHIALLFGCVAGARGASDALLTEVIEGERARTRGTRAPRAAAAGGDEGVAGGEGGGSGKGGKGRGKGGREEGAAKKAKVGEGGS